MRRALLALLVVSTLGAAAPQGTVSVSQLAARVDSLEARVSRLEARRADWRQYVRADSTRTQCRAITKAGTRCKRILAGTVGRDIKADTLCTQHRRAVK